MPVTRRQFCAVGAAFTSVAIGGCLGDDGDETPADPETDGWAWSGSIPVDAAVQYHDPACGCCTEYVSYLEEHGIDVEVSEVDDLGSVKTDLSVPDDVRSCHTTELGDYLIEGHVPLEAVEALFENDSDVLGIAAPGMPRHSPGMGPRGDEPLAIYAFEEGGESYEYLQV